MGFGELDASTTVRFIFGTAAAVLFFVTILTHELAHSYLAMKYGVRIRSITLMLFGGVASMEEMPKAPGQELKMAFAGPLSSLLVGAASYGVMFALDSSSDATVIQGLAILFGLIALYNVLLAAFNLLPAFPMDGGRVLRSYLASRMSHLEATRKAAKVGRYAAIGMGFFGLITFNIWLIVIAFFVYIGATDEEQATVISDSLEGLKVRQIMTDAVQVVHPDMSVHQLLDLMHATRHMGFPVTMGGLVGIVTITDAQKVPMDRLYFAKVGDIMTKDVVTVSPEMDAAQAFKLMGERKIGRLVVLQDGRIAGILTSKDLRRAVDLANARMRGQGPMSYPPLQVPPPPPSPPTASS
jgi:Zn-dependent protease